ncbi:MAG: HAMP domain-containing histidine kinase [Lachnospiraceae bacterium]|nr:HAMP domain-containing histidine kinase [Lachnospiraceae bacterium]
MKKERGIKEAYIRLCISVTAILLLIFMAAVFVMHKKNKDEDYLYRIEINRVENELKNSPFIPDISQYSTITNVSAFDPSFEDIYDSEDHYVIKKVNGTFYRIDYRTDLSRERAEGIRLICILMIVIFAALMIVLFFLYYAFVRDLGRLSEYPFELAKGHMVVPLKEKRSGYFGRFLWGLDMLREKLESEKRKNLKLQKEKNVFLLSLSHDIKTPLSAIKLYAASLKKDLYKDRDKVAEIYEKIDDNAGEIERYVSKLTASANDEFLDVDVSGGEFYLSEALDYVKGYYSDKLKTIGTKLSFEEPPGILVHGDRERFVEVLQNIFENAVKYGDGKEISVSFFDEEDCKLVTVSNTGCTLPEEEIEHIFDSFYRGSNAGSKPGSGLGLFICRKLMLKMKGEIFATKDGDEMKVTLVCRKM